MDGESVGSGCLGRVKTCPVLQLPEPPAIQSWNAQDTDTSKASAQRSDGGSVKAPASDTIAGLATSGVPNDCQEVCEEHEKVPDRASLAGKQTQGLGQGEAALLHHLPQTQRPKVNP